LSKVKRCMQHARRLEHREGQGHTGVVVRACVRVKLLVGDRRSREWQFVCGCAKMLRDRVCVCVLGVDVRVRLRGRGHHTLVFVAGPARPRRFCRKRERAVSWLNRPADDMRSCPLAVHHGLCARHERSSGLELGSHRHDHTWAGRVAIAVDAQLR
jgi:hypothetical protein